MFEPIIREQYFVWGGVWEDFNFQSIEPGKYEEYGPFDSYQEAYDTWKSKVWLNVDNGLHRLLLTCEDPDLSTTLETGVWS